MAKGFGTALKVYKGTVKLLLVISSSSQEQLLVLHSSVQASSSARDSPDQAICCQPTIPVLCLLAEAQHLPGFYGLIS